MPYCCHSMNISAFLCWKIISVPCVRKKPQRVATLTRKRAMPFFRTGLQKSRGSMANHHKEKFDHLSDATDETP